MKNSWRVILLALMVACATILSLGSAHAVSLYDNVYHTTSQLVLRYQQCAPVDVSYTLKNHLGTMRNSFLSRSANSSWGVSEWPHHDDNVNQNFVVVYWSDDAPLSADWLSYSGTVVTDADHIVYLYLDSDCSVKQYYGTGVIDISMQIGAVTNFFFTGAANYPAGYEGKQIVSAQPGAKYVAMGDSFSSGEGNPPFEPGTDTSDNKCHRSSRAYPRLLQNDPDLDLGSMAFVACSGAKTGDVLYGGSGEGNWGEGAQTDVLSADTETVTITIGGNDIGFKELTTECIASTCDEFTTVYQNSMNSISNALPSKLDSVFSAILTDAPNAEVYVAGYPIVIPYMPIDAPYNEVCSSFIGEYPNTWGDARAAYNVVVSLNDAIQDAVSRQSSTRLHYVDVENGAFEGHDGCSEDSYFEYLHFPFEQEYTAHPNQSGHQAYYVDMKEVISQ